MIKAQKRQNRSLQTHLQEQKNNHHPHDTAMEPTCAGTIRNGQKMNPFPCKRNHYGD
jgi:hypothetical protein